MTNDGVTTGNQYLYDPEGRICAAILGNGWVQYLYNAEGQRVAQGAIQPVNGALSCDTTLNQFAMIHQYLLGPSGEQMTELNSAGAWVHTNVTASGSLIATYQNDGQGVHFHLSDWLGTRRVQTDYNGVSQASYSSLPFGDGLTATGSTDVTEQHFTGKERDTESGLDYFGARYYSSSMGRFSSPDPSGLAYADLTDPQSFNLYSYVRNNPFKNVDPTGLDCVYLNSAGDGVDKDGIDHNSNEGECSVNGGYWAPGNVANNSAVHIVSNSDVIGIDSTSSGQSLFSAANCSGCSTTNRDGSLMGAMTQTFGGNNPGDAHTAFSLMLTVPGNYKPGQAVMRAYTPPPRPHYSNADIFTFCFAAVALQGGMNIPAGSFATGDSSIDPAAESVNAPGKAEYVEYYQTPKGTVSLPTSDPSVGAGLAGLAGQAGTGAACFGGVSSLNRK